MSNSPIRAIVITGHYAAGKGDVTLELSQLLHGTFPTIDFSLERDRDYLNEAVLRDVYQSDAPRPGVEGPHSVIKDIGPPLIFNVKDGSLHQEAHANMVGSISAIPAGSLGIFEIASGPDVPSFQLYQSGEHLVRLLGDFGVIEQTLVLDVLAPYQVRLERNARRPDKVSEEIMAIAATDGGEVFHVRHVLGRHYYQLDNAHHGKLSERVADAFGKFVRPHLEGSLPFVEGNIARGWFR